MPSTRGDLCIVGAGIAGLNALFVASRYLSRDQKVVLIDRRPRVGGMWVDTYDYVRLHQPHPFFTAGTIKWAWDKEPAHLATKPEVLDHLQYCLDVLKRRVQVEECFGYEYESHEEVDGSVRVTCRSADGDRLEVTAGKLIKALSWNVPTNDPLPVSSSQVRSVSPDFCDMRGGEMRASDSPVWVVGGGKTGIDTAHALITSYPGREVNLLAGAGTLFYSRDESFPAGRRRWRTGQPATSFYADWSRLFDGTNESEAMAWFTERMGISLTPRAENCFLGILSAAETETIRGGLNEVLMDYLVDCVDTEDGTRLKLRSGATHDVAPGSWIVNCTGYLNPAERPYEPYVSPSGNVLSVYPGSAFAYLPAYSAYFLTHLMFLGKLGTTPLYELDIDALRATAPRNAFTCTLISHVAYNVLQLLGNVPLRVMTGNGLDFDRWYPLPRRVMAQINLLRQVKTSKDHNRRTLDTVHERFGVRCGPLDHVRAAAR